AMISKEDYDNSTPTNAENVNFSSSYDAGEEPYLSISYWNYGVTNTDNFTPELIKTHKPNAANRDTYVNARGESNQSNIVTTAIDTLGQAAIGDTLVSRISMRIPIDFPLNEAYACSLFLTGTSDQSTTDFNIVGRLGTWDASDTLGRAYFEFTGWQSGGAVAYTGDNIFETFSTANFHVGTDTLIFSQAGLAAVKAASNDTLRILMLSSRDVSASYPATAEYVVYNATDATLRLKWAYNDSIPNEFTMTAIDSDSIAVSWNDRCLDETGYKIVESVGGASVYTVLSTQTDSTTSARAFSNIPLGLSNGYPDDNAFDDNVATFWSTASTAGGSGQGGFPHYIAQDFGASNTKRIGKYTLRTPQGAAGGSWGPGTWTLEATADSSGAWIEIDSQTGISDWPNATPGTQKTYHVNPINTTAYRYWKLEFTKDKNNGEGYIQLAEIEMMEATDTLPADAVSARIGGRVPNTSYVWKAKVVGGAYADSLSAADSTYTHAVALAESLVLYFSAVSDTLKFTADSTGTGNPSYTEYAFQDSISEKWVDFTATPDTFKTGLTVNDDWGWRTLTDLGDTVRVYLIPTAASNLVGKLIALRGKARSGQ
ncbi:MAG: hypothetical protein ABII90_09940, partial [Bacteroidota bacterium]